MTIIKTTLTALSLFLTVSLYGGSGDSYKLANNSRIHVQPNPAHDALLVKTKLQGKITLVNSDGVVILEQNLLKGKNEIPLKNLKPAVYKLLLYCNGVASERRLVVR